MRPHELRAARLVFDMTQTELGEWLGLKSASPRRSIHDYEAGRRVIPGPVARAVELELECRKLRKRKRK